MRKGTRCSCAQNNHMSGESISRSADPQLVYISFDEVFCAPILNPHIALSNSVYLSGNKCFDSRIACMNLTRHLKEF